MTGTFGQAARMAVLAVAMSFVACASFGPGSDDGPADVVPDVAVDDGQPDDLVVPVDNGGETAADTGRDSMPDESPVDTFDSVQPDLVQPDADPELPGEDTKEVVQPVDDGPESDVCIPDCGEPGTETARICGPDGCGDVCGYCEYGFACNVGNGKCIEICIPDCLEEGKVCGDDGCSGSCGECGINYVCGLDFKCYPDVCQSDCEEKGMECGVDKCGNSCGTCGESEVCSVGGKCAPGACFGVDKERNTCSLDGRYQYQCITSGSTESLLKIDCYAVTGPQCGTRGCDCHYNPWSGLNECIEKPPCVPDCEGKECGDDGCGGQCDVCTGGWRCDTKFKCRPMAGADCVWIDWVGTCWDDNWLYTCSSDMIGQGEIMAEDCTALGKICYYNLSAQQYICGNI